MISRPLRALVALAIVPACRSERYVSQSLAGALGDGLGVCVCVRGASSVDDPRRGVRAKAREGSPMATSSVWRCADSRTLCFSEAARLFRASVGGQDVVCKIPRTP